MVESASLLTRCPLTGTASSNLALSDFGPPKRTYVVIKSVSVREGDFEACYRKRRRVFHQDSSKLRRDEIRYKNVNMYYVYSLKCKDGYYTGCTDDLKSRLKRHQNGQVPATLKRLPVKLAFYLVVVDKHKAFKFGKYLKSGSGRAFIKKHLA